MRFAVYLLLIAATFYFASMFRYEPLLMVGLVEVLLMAAMLPLPFFVGRKLTVRLQQVQQSEGTSAASLQKGISAGIDRKGTSADNETQQPNGEISTYYIEKGLGYSFLMNVTNRGKLPGGPVRIHLKISYVGQNVSGDRGKRTIAEKPTSKYKPTLKSMSTLKAIRSREKIIGASNPGDNSLEAHITFPYCGLVSIRMKRAYVYDYFSLFRAGLHYREQIPYAVMPSLCGMQFLFFPSMQQESVDGMNAYPEKVDWGYDILQVRESRPGEEEHQVHWKLSARSDKVIVKEYEREDSLIAYLFLENSELYKAGLAGKSAFYEVVYALILGLIEQELTVKMFYFDGTKQSYEHTEVRNLTELQEALLILYQLVAQPMQLSLGLPTLPWGDGMFADRYNDTYPLSTPLCGDGMLVDGSDGDYERGYNFRVNVDLQLFYRNELLWTFEEDTVEQDVIEQVFTL
jgi:hypothetical protein